MYAKILSLSCLTLRRRATHIELKQQIIARGCRLENADVVTYPVFLTLGYAFSDPSDIPDFL